jgi:ethanolamine utilization protein, eutP
LKKILLIGKSMCGKTTLTQRIHGLDIQYEKTQMLKYSDDILDTPGEYMENRMLYKALIISSYDCDVIGMVQACNEEHNVFPPGFSTAFTKPVIGIVTKSDLGGDVERACEILENAGAQKVFVVSSYENKGIEELVKYLEDDNGQLEGDK